MRVFCEDKHGKVQTGAFTTANVKEQARSQVQNMLASEHASRLCVVRDEDMVSSTNHIADELREQMLAFKYVYTDKPNGDTKAQLCGKSFGHNDDLVMALLILSFWSVVALSKPTCLTL
jgi:hypothetical protein